MICRRGVYYLARRPQSSQAGVKQATTKGHAVVSTGLVPVPSLSKLPTHSHSSFLLASLTHSPSLFCTACAFRPSRACCTRALLSPLSVSAAPCPIKHRASLLFEFQHRQQAVVCQSVLAVSCVSLLPARRPSCSEL